MKSLLVVVALLFSSAVFANPCFTKQSVRSWDYDSSRQALIVNAFSRVYELDVPFCHELPWARAIAFESFGGGSFICSGDDIVVIDAWNSVREKCRIYSIKQVK